MKLQTALKIEEYIDSAGIDYDANLFFMGSCFTDNIGGKLKKHKFTICLNPLEISYNPVSLKKHIDYISGSKNLIQADFFKTEMGYVHYDFHSNLAKPSQMESLEFIQNIISNCTLKLQEASHIFISYGTAIVHELIENHEESDIEVSSKNSTSVVSENIVNNCHKQYFKKFKSRTLSFDRLTRCIKSTIDTLKKLNPQVKIIFTLSPVRHTRNGLINDRRSKSLLHAAIHHQVDLNHNCFYFPSYEILVDELRDYRFYKEDMSHPSDQAVEYIWTKFGESFFSKKTKDEVKSIGNLLLQLKHDSKHKETESYKEFRETLFKLLKEKNSPRINFEKEISELKKEIATL